jgi:hypothetical protein
MLNVKEFLMFIKTSFAFKASQQTADEDDQASDITEQSEPIDEPVISKSIEKPKKILNRFNFCEQGIQTYTSPKKV